MNSGPFVLCQTELKVTGYELANPKITDQPSLVRYFRVLAAADKDQLDLAMTLAGKAICKVVQSLANTRKEIQFDCYYKN